MIRLALVALAVTASAAQAGVGDAMPQRATDAVPHIPRMMPGPGHVTHGDLDDAWESFKDWLRPKLGRAIPGEMIF